MSMVSVDDGFGIVESVTVYHEGQTACAFEVATHDGVTEANSTFDGVRVWCGDRFAVVRWRSDFTVHAYGHRQVSARSVFVAAAGIPDGEREGRVVYRCSR